MKKILSIVSVSAMVLMLSTGCTTSSEGLSVSDSSVHSSLFTGDNQANKNAIYVGHADSKMVMNAIKNAGKKTGWRVTEFKSESVIVEKNIDGDDMSSTIKLHNGYISGDNENASMDELKDLRRAIIAELQDGSKHH